MLKYLIKMSAAEDSSYARDGPKMGVAGEGEEWERAHPGGCERIFGPTGEDWTPADGRESYRRSLRTGELVYYGGAVVTARKSTGGKAPRKRLASAPAPKAQSDDEAGCSGSDFNSRMHPRNIYRRKRPDFAALAAKYPAKLGKYVKARSNPPGGVASAAPPQQNGVVVSWTDPGARVEIARALLADDFGIKWDFPSDGKNLCPSVARSLNYLHWIEDLVGLECDISKDDIRGIDVGTGASAIYPILACAMHPNWSFIASDILEASVRSAKQIVASNGWGNRVRVIHVAPRDLISGLLVGSESNVHFSMCNPPFFSEFASSHSGFQGLEEEKAAGEGGEVAFISRIIADSAKEACRQKVAWFTSMVGKKASLGPLKKQLLSIGILPGCIRTTTLYQGKTLRWAIAWSFDQKRSARQGDGVYSGGRKRRKLEASFEAPHVSLDAFCERVLEAIDKSEEPAIVWDGESDVACEARSVSVLGSSRRQGGVDVTIRGRAGAFDASSKLNFWTFAQRFEQDILRTNRWWRRKMKNNIDNVSSKAMQ